MEFNIPEQYKNIAVKLSGGADSTLLLYMTIHWLQENKRDDVMVHAMTLTELRNNFSNSRMSMQTINWILKKTKFTNFKMHHTLYTYEKGDDEYFLNLENEIIVNNKLDLVLSGNNANPLERPIYIEDGNGKTRDLSEMFLEERDADQPRYLNHPLDTSRALRKCDFYQPFHRSDKRDIANLYKQYDIMDLFRITKSCTTPGSTPTTLCGTCWQCLERKWAFGDEHNKVGPISD